MRRQSKDKILQKIEESEQKILQKIEELKQKIEELETKSVLSIDDQLFFGVVFSLIILFATLPITELSSLIGYMSGLSIDQASIFAEKIRIVGFSSMLISCLTRYYASISEGETSKRSRFYSLLFFIAGLETLLFILITSAFPSPITTSRRGENWKLYITTYLPLGAFILIPVYFAAAYMENRILKFYRSKGLISDKYTKTIVSSFFLMLDLSLCITLIIDLLAIHIFMHPLQGILKTIIASLICCILFLITLLKKSKRSLFNV